MDLVAISAWCDVDLKDRTEAEESSRASIKDRHINPWHLSMRVHHNWIGREGGSERL
jgi:hypothetical protein